MRNNRRKDRIYPHLHREVSALDPDRSAIPSGPACFRLLLRRVPFGRFRLIVSAVCALILASARLGLFFLLRDMIRLIGSGTLPVGNRLLYRLASALSHHPIPPSDPHTVQVVSLAVRPVTGRVSVPLATGSGTEVDLFLDLILICALLLILLSLLAGVLLGRESRLIARNTSSKLRADLFHTWQKLPLHYFDTHETGDLLSVFTDDTKTAGNWIGIAVPRLFADALLTLTALFYLFSVCPSLSLIPLIGLPFLVWADLSLTRTADRAESEESVTSSAVRSCLRDALDNAPCGQVPTAPDGPVSPFRFAALNQRNRTSHRCVRFLRDRISPLMQALDLLLLTLTAGCGIALCLNGSPDAGSLVVFTVSLGQILSVYRRLIRTFSRFRPACAAVQRLYAVSHEPPELPDRPDALNLPDSGGHIVFDDVSFGYTPDQPVLHHIHLYAHAGQTITIIGNDQDGKAALRDLLLRFAETDRGMVMLDGIDIRTYKKEEVRARVALATRHTHLFSGTVMENIRCGRPDAADDEVIRAAETASAHAFILRLKNGYHTVLTDGGESLPPLVRQLIGIARAILSNAPILILDGAADDADPRTEQQIERHMAPFVRNRTVFVLTNRLIAARHADAVLLMENGQIIERGNHQQLMSLKGRYFDLYMGREKPFAGSV